MVVQIIFRAIQILISVAVLIMAFYTAKGFWQGLKEDIREFRDVLDNN